MKRNRIKPTTEKREQASERTSKREKKPYENQNKSYVIFQCEFHVPNKHIEFIRGTPGLAFKEQQSLCFHLESYSSTLANGILWLEHVLTAKNEAYSMLRYNCVCIKLHIRRKKENRVNPRSSSIQCVVHSTYMQHWCKFINFIEANSYYVFKINSTHYIVLHHRLSSFFQWSHNSSPWIDVVLHIKKRKPDCWAHSFPRFFTHSEIHSI